MTPITRKKNMGASRNHMTTAGSLTLTWRGCSFDIDAVWADPHHTMRGEEITQADHATGCLCFHGQQPIAPRGARILETTLRQDLPVIQLALPHVEHL